MKYQMQIKLVFPQLLIASIFLVSNAAKAADTAPYPTDSVFSSIGTNGLNLGYGKRFNSSWGGRVMLNTGVTMEADNEKVHGNRYDIEFKSGVGANVLADFYPINDSGFRVSGGFNIASHKMELNGNKKNAAYTFNGHQYTSAQVGQLDGDATFQTVAPYVGIGWESSPFSSGWRFVSDLGVAYVGNSGSTLKASGAASNAVLRQDVSAESKHLRDDGAAIVASIGVSYSF